MTIVPKQHRLPPRWFRGAALAGPLVLVAGLGLLYAAGSFGKANPGTCKVDAATLARLDPLIHGEVAALTLRRDPRPAPPLNFKDASGTNRTLADFKGRTVLLNLWATWCIPCRKEMPALDRLQAQLGGANFAVVAINIDTARLERPKQFLQEAGITTLPLYTDASAGALQVFKGDGQPLGLPTTLLIDRGGCELGTMAGAAAWDSPDATRLIEAAKEAQAPPT